MSMQEALFELKLIEHKIGSPLTDEQREFASNFTKDTITFANPGTGKTHTLTAGIILAQKYYKVDPEKIYCMSYTNAATNEISSRFKRLAGICRVSKKVNFSTFHSFSYKLLKSAYPGFEINNGEDIEDSIKDMSEYVKLTMPEYPCDRKKIYQIIDTINNLNNAFVFDEESVALRYNFARLKMSVSEFQKLRKLWFDRGLITERITRGDIPLYCLYALIKKPEVAEDWNGKYDIMIVDEFQDVSLLHLEILRRVASNLIVVGDMKQQIYVYNGSCPEIVEAYLKARPDARKCQLTQSFRCNQAIADFATNVISPNETEDAKFSGRPGSTDDTNCIEFVDRHNLDWKRIFKDTNSETLNDIMILYRNNASTIPVIDELYSKNIPYRCPKFSRVMDIPVLSTLCDLVNSAWNPNDIKFAREALGHFPEFKYQKYNINEYINIMRKGNKTVFELSGIVEEESSREILSAMREANRRISDKKSAGNVIVSLKTVYDRYIKPNEFFPNEDTYYYNMVAPICNIRTYPEMYQREIDKHDRALKCINADMGVRCYTMHSSKGLEAKHIYMLDVNEGIFPNIKKLEDKSRLDCEYDASLDVRAERNLLYVAITRAKDTVTISYSDEFLCSLVSTPESNIYSNYDKVYRSQHRLYDDLSVFERLICMV